MQYSEETFSSGFVAMQARLLAIGAGQEEPDYAYLMMGPIRNMIERGEGISPLFDFARRDLETVAKGEFLVPDEHEIRSEELAAYETAQQFSRVVIAAIEGYMAYGKAVTGQIGEVMGLLRNMNLTLRLAEGMYGTLQRPEEHIPLNAVRDYAFDQHAFALRVIGSKLPSDLGEELEFMLESTELRR